ILRPFSTDVENDSPALTPIAVDAVNHNALIARDSEGSGIAYTVDQRLRCCFSMVRFRKRCERRTDQMQNNSDNHQSHEQFNQTETLLAHEISLPGMRWPAQSLRE